MPPELIASYHHYYVYTHSLVILSIIALVWYIVRRRPPWLLFPWGLHILMDIPTHERYQTPFLYPLSDWAVEGYSWSRAPMLIANGAGLLLAYGLLYWYYWRRKLPRRQMPWLEDLQGVA